MKKHILSISYDKALLVTRHMLLENAGYSVTSAFGFAEAMEICSARHNFDLIVMGHSMPQKDKAALLLALRLGCSAPLVSILRHGDSPTPHASFYVDAQDGPLALLQLVRTALEVNTGHDGGQLSPANAVP